MSTRKFSVFVDEPSATKRPLSRSVSASAVLTTRSENTFGSVRSVLGAVPEKENIHPVTGSSTTSSQTGKKRKASESGSVLVTKAFAPVTIEAKPKRAEIKRKQSSSKQSKVSKEPLKKNTEPRKILGATNHTNAPLKRTPSAPPSRGSPVTLDAVPEEIEEKVTANEDTEGEKKAHNVSQSQIDGRCYDLTVSPLADVTDAYLQSSESKEEEVNDEDLPEYRIVKEVR